MKQWRKTNATHVKAYKKKRGTPPKELESARRRAAVHRAEATATSRDSNRQYQRIWMRKKWTNSPEFRQKSNERNKTWRLQNSNKVRNYKELDSRKRRAAKWAVNECFTPYQKGKVRKQFGRSCFRCGATKKLCMDHHMPLSRGFALDYGNAVVLCNRCNAKKGVKLPSEFYTLDELARLESYLAEQRTWKQPPSKLRALGQLNKSS